MKGDPVGLIVEHHTGHHQQLGKMHHVDPCIEGEGAGMRAEWGGVYSGGGDA